MQLWSFRKCREEAENGGALTAESFLKIILTRRIFAAMLCAAAVLLAVLILFAVLHSDEKVWENIQTHEVQEFVLSVDDCIEYSIDMTDGDCVKSTLVMPSKVFTLETDVGGSTQQSDYYVYLDASGNEGIFRFSGELSEEVRTWLADWDAFTEDAPEPVEIFGLRGELSIIATDEETQQIAQLYDGKSYIDVGAHLVVREVEIPGAIEAAAAQEAEMKEYEERRQGFLAGVYASLVLFALAAVAAVEGGRMYAKARRAFMAEMDYQD